MIAYKFWLNKRETGAVKRSGAGGEVGYGKTLLRDQETERGEFLLSFCKESIILNAYESWLNKRETGAVKRSGAGGEVGYGKTYYFEIRRLKEVSFH